MSVIAPFYGTAKEARGCVERFGAIRLRDGDEVLIADNTPGGVVAGVVPEGSTVQVVEAWSRQSPYTARNTAAAVARNDWLVFCDGDVEPRVDLLDAYYADPPPERCGIVAGRIADRAGQHGLIAAYVSERGHYDQARGVAHPYRPVVLTANMLVRREAFDAVGGFCDGVRSGADSDFSWRVNAAGWDVRYAAEPWVVHEHRDSVRAIARQAARDGAGKAWLERRAPGSALWPGMRGLARCVAGVPVWLLRLQGRQAAFKVVDAVAICAERAGGLADNAAADRATRPAAAVVIAETFPDQATEDVLDLAARNPGGLRVEAAVRPEVLDPRTQGLDTAYLEEDGVLHRWRALVRVAAGSPLRCLRFVRATGWRRLLMEAPRVQRIRRLADAEVYAVDGDRTELGALIGVAVAQLQSTKVR